MNIVCSENFYFYNIIIMSHGNDYYINHCPIIYTDKTATHKIIIINIMEHVVHTHTHTKIKKNCLKCYTCIRRVVECIIQN